MNKQLQMHLFFSLKNKLWCLKMFSRVMKICMFLSVLKLVNNFKLFIWEILYFSNKELQTTYKFNERVILTKVKMKKNF